MLTRKELDIIKSSTEFDEKSNEYKVPLFYFKNK